MLATISISPFLPSDTTFRKLFTAFEGGAGHMPIRDGIEVPEFLRHYGTTWMILSEE